MDKQADRSNNADERFVYPCAYRTVTAMPGADDSVWNETQTIKLAETVTGSRPRMTTEVRMFRGESALFVRFECEDDHTLATYDNHDDPLYDEDVVELFLRGTDRPEEYLEFEASPRNIKFDARILNRRPAAIEVGTEWHAAGWQSTVTGSVEEGGLTYVWALPFDDLGFGTPQPGDRWYMNCYRIDRGEDAAQDEYSAWSPTGAIDFHVPSCFGTLLFV